MSFAPAIAEHPLSLVKLTAPRSWRAIVLPIREFYGVISLTAFETLGKHLTGFIPPFPEKLTGRLGALFQNCSSGRPGVILPRAAPICHALHGLNFPIHRAREPSGTAWKPSAVNTKACEQALAASGQVWSNWGPEPDDSSAVDYNSTEVCRTGGWQAAECSLAERYRRDGLALVLNN